MHWVLGAVSMMCLTWLACADTVKLKDGTVLEGTITEEDAISVTIHAERANGAVAEKRWMLKSDTMDVHHATAEEKATRAMELAFVSLQKLHIDPTNSFQIEYYDRTLTNVFRKFQADYPNSLHAKEVSDKIVEWEAERALVAAGKLKTRGQWISAEEIAARATREAVQQAYQQGLIFLRQRNSSEAVKRFEFVIDRTDDTTQAQQARQLRLDAYQQWVTTLGQQRRWLADEIKRLEQRVNDARNANAQADARVSQPSRGGDIRARSRSLGGARGVDAGGTTRLEADTEGAQSIAAATRAQSELRTAENQLAEAQQEAAAVETTLAKIQPQVASIGITVAPSGEVVATHQVVTAPDHPAAATETPDVVSGIGQFATAYWVYFLAGAVILIWLVSRSLGR